MPRPIRPSTLVRRGGLLAAAAVFAVALTACQPEPAATPTTSPSTSASATGTPNASASPTATPSPTVSTDIALPSSCDAIYSAGMRADLDANLAPLNDPGITMYSTQNTTALEILDSGIPALRCTWGLPSERGLATTIALVDPAQSAEIAEALPHAGFSCEQAQGGTVCRLTDSLIDYDDNIVERGESHFLRGNSWVATTWLGYGPQGYTEDVAATIWG